MSTLPPPTPGQPASGQPMMQPPVPAQPVAPPMSEASRLINTFIAPSKTFTDLKRKASWWAPWLVVSVFSLIAAVVIVQKVDMARLVQHRMEQSKRAQQAMERLSPAQLEQAIRIQAVAQKIGFFARPVIALIFGLIAAAIYMVIFNFGFAAQVPFQRCLAIVFYASLPLIVKSVLVCVALLFSADPGGIDPDINPVATNPGFFMDPKSNKFLWGLASGLDLIGIWSVVLTGLGFAICSAGGKLRPSTAIITVLVVYAVIIAAFAALGAAF